MKGPRRGRPFNRSQPLGQWMWDVGVSQEEVAAVTGINHRVLCDYLAGRQKIRNVHLVRLCALFECEAEDLLPPAQFPGVPHDHPAPVEGCYRCELSADEDSQAL